MLVIVVDGGPTSAQHGPRPHVCLVLAQHLYVGYVPQCKGVISWRKLSWSSCSFSLHYPPDQAEQLLASMTRLKKKTQLDTYSIIPANAKCLYNICKMLDQRWRRWANIVQMLYKWFVFAGMPPLRDTSEEFTNFRWTILDYAWTNSIHEYFLNSSQKSSLTVQGMSVNIKWPRTVHD